MGSMMNGKLHIPRMAVAILVLGGACGEDESGSGDDAGANPRSDRSDGGTSAAEDVDSSSDDGNTSDAGGVQGDDGGVDVSKARLARVAQDFCKTAFACDAEMAMGHLQDETHCVDFISEIIESDMGEDGDECGDALLDTYDCYATASCEEESYTVCAEHIELVVEYCPNSPRNAE
jgi:hypothetical protein